MAILRKPGTVIPVYLPSEASKVKDEDRVVVWIRVPDKGTYLQVEEICGSDFGNFETSRRVIGLLVDRIDNLKTEAGEDFKLEKDGTSGYLTDDCAAWLAPYINEIGALCVNSGRLTPAERKNCSSP